jgi:membrane-associated phospholipid phosphatase
MILGRGLLIALLAVGGISYEALNRPSGQLHSLATPFDAVVPFVPLFAIPYLLFLPFLLVTFLLLGFTNWVRFRELAIATILTFVAADLCFLYFQTVVTRPVVSGDDLGSQLVRFVYAHDQPYNDFPSLHTAGSLLCTFAYFRWRRVYGFLSLPLVLAIIASTVLIRQHVLADVAGGLALAWVTYGIARRLPAPRGRSVDLRERMGARDARSR